MANTETQEKHRDGARNSDAAKLSPGELLDAAQLLTPIAMYSLSHPGPLEGQGILAVVALWR